MSKIGDVYEITKDVKGTYYVQLVCVDLPNMNSDVVVVTQKNPLENDIRLKDLLFYTHTIVGLGAREGLWKKIGNKQPSIKISKLAFKSGYPTEQLNEMIYKAKMINDFDNVTDHDLMEFHRQTEAFYKYQ